MLLTVTDPQVILQSFSVSQLDVLVLQPETLLFWFTLMFPAMLFSLRKPPYVTCLAPNSRQTQLVTFPMFYIPLD